MEELERIKNVEVESVYYDPVPVLNTKDIKKNDASMDIITTNRSAGKTTGFLILALKLYHDIEDAVKLFKTTGNQTVLLYRYSYELSACPAIFQDVLAMYPELGTEMVGISFANGLFYKLLLDGNVFGFGIALNNPDSLKKFSPQFAKVGLVIMDEYQSETGKYLANEVEKFQSILLTIARGGGKQSRKIKVILLGNMVTIMNPYFISLGIHKRVRKESKFIRGDGWVAEFGFNESASEAIKGNPLFNMFENSKYMTYSTESVYLKDTTAFIESPKGKSKYICTIVYDGMEMGLREFFSDGIMHVSEKIEKSCTTVIAFKGADHNQNTVMLNRYSYTFKAIKDSYMRGVMRFDNVKTKNAMFDILAVDIYK